MILALLNPNDLSTSIADGHSLIKFSFKSYCKIVFEQGPFKNILKCDLELFNLLSIVHFVPNLPDSPPSELLYPLFWKVAMQLCMRNPTLLANPTLQKFDYCQAMWYRYCGQARANANMPDLEGLIRIKNNWLRMMLFSLVFLVYLFTHQ